jgi:hypothetical protein
MVVMSQRFFLEMVTSGSCQCSAPEFQQYTSAGVLGIIIPSEFIIDFLQSYETNVMKLYSLCGFIRGCIQKFPDCVDNEINHNNNNV